MTADNVLDLYNLLRDRGITVWIDGGWGVDALLSRQTREHDDLDIAVPRKDNAELRQLLESDGYKEEKRFDSSEFMYVMKNEAGQEVDIHAFEYDETGKNIYGVEYPFGSLTGTGIISGQKVNCIDPLFQLQFKTGYNPREKDIYDVQALCEKFGFELPSRYANCKSIMISETDIAAHKINASVGVMREPDYECLPEFLYQAIYIPEGEELPPRSVIDDPEIFVYIKDFGTQPGDLGVVAQQNGQIIGAAWTRIIPAYGHIDIETPELAISILPEFRNYGIGTKLMKKLFEVLKNNGYKQTSLSVQKDNPAVRFYQRIGYEMSGERIDHAEHEDYLMIKKL